MHYLLLVRLSICAFEYVCSVRLLRNGIYIKCAYMKRRLWSSECGLKCKCSESEWCESASFIPLGQYFALLDTASKFMCLDCAACIHLYNTPHAAIHLMHNILTRRVFPNQLEIYVLVWLELTFLYLCYAHSALRQGVDN